jgi:hypothetical protein
MIVFNEETEKLKHDSVLHGIPNLRYVVASRNSLGGVSEANKILEPVLDALTRPLTADEKVTGRWAPAQPTRRSRSRGFSEPLSPSTATASRWSFPLKSALRGCSKGRVTVRTS